MARSPSRRERDPNQHLVGYARVSTEEQSLDLQLRALRGAGVKDEDIYIDEGKSAASLDRDGLNAALKACRPAEHGRPASKLLFWKLDRVSRSVSDLIDLFKALRERGVEGESLTEYFNSDTPIGKFTFHVLAAVAELERDLTLERTRAGLAAAREMGRVGGAPRQFTRDKEREIAAAYWKRPKVGRTDNAHTELLAKRYKIAPQSVANIRDRHPDLKPPEAPAPNTKLWRENVERLKKEAAQAKRTRAKALRQAADVIREGGPMAALGMVGLTLLKGSVDDL